MFNDDKKQIFIKAYYNKQGAIDRITKLFNSSERYERQFGKDLAEFSDEELLELLNNIGGFRNSSKNTSCFLINKYLRWARDNGFRVVCDGVKSDDDAAVMKFREKMIFNIDHLNRYMDAVFGEIDECTSGLLCRCYFWLAFCGVDIADAERLCDEDVDVDLMRVMVRGHEVPLYEEAIPAFKKLKSLKELRVFNPLYPDKIIMMQRESGSRLLRGAKRAGVSQEMVQDGKRGNMSGEVQRRTKKAVEKGLVTSRINYSTVKMSGTLYRMSVREEMGIKPDFSYLAEAHLKGKTFSSSASYNASFFRIKKNYDSDYAVWKRAYELYKEDSHL